MRLPTLLARRSYSSLCFKDLKPGILGLWALAQVSRWRELFYFWSPHMSSFWKLPFMRFWSTCQSHGPSSPPRGSHDKDGGNGVSPGKEWEISRTLLGHRGSITSDTWTVWKARQVAQHSHSQQQTCLLPRQSSDRTVR